MVFLYRLGGTFEKLTKNELLDKSFGFYGVAQMPTFNLNPKRFVFLKKNAGAKVSMIFLCFEVQFGKNAW